MVLEEVLLPIGVLGFLIDHGILRVGYRAMVAFHDGDSPADRFAEHFAHAPAEVNALLGGLAFA
jgi:hypothetical protein